MSIALDAMGGDHAPGEIVLGALQAAPDVHHKIILVGDPAAIQKFLPRPVPSNIVIHPASEVIEMDDKPTEAIRKKRDASLVVAADLVKQGQAGVVVSAGNTGAATAACLLSWRQVQGFHRPAIATPMPNYYDGFYLLDAGASPDIEPHHLVEFAHMGRAYVSKVLGRINPKVHLLNIGEEEGKGNAFAKSAFAALAKHDWFSGNIESKAVFHEPCDVVLCDAFVGNILLKAAEGVGELVVKMIREAMPASKLAQLPYLPLKKILSPLRHKMDYAEVGGSPLLGLNGLCIIAHGRSNAKAIRNAILLAQKGIDNDVVEEIRRAAAAV